MTKETLNKKYKETYKREHKRSTNQDIQAIKWDLQKMSKETYKNYYKSTIKVTNRDIQTKTYLHFKEVEHNFLHTFKDSALFSMYAIKWQHSNFQNIRISKNDNRATFHSDKRATFLEYVCKHINRYIHIYVCIYTCICTWQDSYFSCYE